MSVALGMKSAVEPILTGRRRRGEELTRLRGEWAQARQQRGEELKRVVQARQRRGEELKRFLGEVRADMAAARAEWRRVFVAPAPPVPAPPVAVAPAPPVVEKPPTERVFTYLAEHPDGARVRELEEALGVPRSQLEEALHSLMEEGKVRRERGLYFAR